MNISRAITLAAAASLLSAQPLSAADMSKTDAMRQSFLEYARCTLSVRAEDARSAVSLFPDSRAEMQALKSLPTSTCQKYTTASFSTRLLRGALYAAMYQDRFANGAPATIAPKPDYAAGADKKLTPEQQAMIQLRDFADCVVRRDGANAHTAVIGPIGSDAEKAAFASLAVSFDACMTQGQKVALSKPVVVGLLAEVLYRGAQG